MIPAQRHGLIVDHLNKVKAASIQELADLIGASPSTIRRDLEALEKESFLDRTHGGAVLAQPRSTFEPDFKIAAQIARNEKSAIAREAALRVQAGNSVIFDSSSTVRETAQAIIERGIALTAITNDLATASLFVEAPGISTIITGGTVRTGSMTLLGSPGTDFLREIHADLAFVGAHSVYDLKLSETSLDTAFMKRTMIGAANSVILLADSSKFYKPSFSQICGIEAIDEVITDTRLPFEISERIVAAGTKLTAVAV